MAKRKSRIAKPNRAAEADTVAAWQERIAPTEVVRVEMPDKSTSVTRRRKPDARVWGAMTPAQVLAAELIVEGWLLAGGTIGVPVANYRGVPIRMTCEATENIRRAERLVRRFRAWLKACRALPFTAAHVLAYLGQGETLRALETQAQVRNGTGREHLFAALDVYVAILQASARQPEMTNRTAT